jgi:hypothetical protein
MNTPVAESSEQNCYNNNNVTPKERRGERNPYRTYTVTETLSRVTFILKSPCTTEFKYRYLMFFLARGFSPFL